MKVFISHSYRDRDFAAKLVDLLKTRNFEAWTAAEQLEPGMEWKVGVVQTISDADGFLFLVGPDSEESRAQQFEWQAALESDWDRDPQRPMIPILLGDVRVPAFLADRWVVRVGPDQEAPIDLIIHLLLHREETQLPINYDLARQEQTRRLDVLKHFALSLKTQSPSIERHSSSR